MRRANNRGDTTTHVCVCVPLTSDIVVRALLQKDKTQELYKHQHFGNGGNCKMATDKNLYATLDRAVFND